MHSRPGWLQRGPWELLAVLTLTAVLLLPTLRTGWLGDDCLNCTLHGLWKRHGAGLIVETGQQIKSWSLHQGRINPVTHIWKNAWFYCVTNVLVHKLLILFLVGLNLVFFHRLLRLIGLTRSASALTCLLVAGLIQLRTYHDPILGFNGLLQLVLALTLASLGLLQVHLRSGRLLPLAGSFLCYLLSVLTYETCLLFVLLHLVLLGAAGKKGVRPLKKGGQTPFLPAALILHPYKKRHSIAIGLSFLMVPLVMMVLVYHIRHSPNYRELSPDYRMVLVPSVVGSTLAKQLLAALPGVYLLFDPSRLFSSETFRREVLRHVWLVILVLPLTGYLLRKMAQQEHPSLLPWARVGLLGLLLALLPALPIAVCFRYQQELSYGLGYLPVYIQYFGVALLLLSLLVQLLRLTRGRLLPQMLVLTLAGVAVSALTVLHYACNQMVVHAYRPLAQLRPQIEEVVRAGGLGSFPAGSLLVADSFMWDTANHGAYFYTMHTGTILHFASSQELPPNLRSQSLTAALSTQRDLFRIRYADIYQDDGFIAVGQLTRLESLPTGRLSRSFLVLNRIAVRERSLGGKPLKQTFFGLTANSAASEAPVHLPRSAFRLVQKTGCWAIYEPAADGPVLDGESIRVLFDRHYPLVFSWRKGFCDREGAEASTWHWCASSHGDIAVRNPTPFARTVRITMRCASAQQGTGYHLTIDAPHYHAGVPLSSALSEEVSWTMQAAPGQSVIHFICDAPPVTPGGNDTRSLFFRIDAFAAREIDSAAHLEYDCTQVFEGSP